MSQHTTPSNVQNLAKITADTAMSIATSTDAILAAVYTITDQPLLDATFSDLASRIDNLSSMADQFQNLSAAIEKALHPAPPATQA